MIFRTNKITNYTKIDNRYLEDKNISLKAKGLLTLMLSLPDSWKFNINGLCLLCKESKDAVVKAGKTVATSVANVARPYGEVAKGQLQEAGTQAKGLFNKGVKTLIKSLERLEEKTK